MNRIINYLCAICWAVAVAITNAEEIAIEIDNDNADIEFDHSVEKVEDGQVYYSCKLEEGVIVSKDPRQRKISVLQYRHPEVTKEHYMIKGEVRTVGWEPGLSGYLEMWSHLPAEKGGTEIVASFFSRTMAPAGPMKKLASNDDQWRTFALPAQINDGSGRKPLRLDLNVILEGGSGDEEVSEKARVQLRNIHFVPDASEIFGKHASSTTPGGVTATNDSPKTGFSWLSFVVGFVVAAGIGLLWLFIRRRQVESELQRIREVDSMG